jgi:hypothetical protein
MIKLPSIKRGDSFDFHIDISVPEGSTLIVSRAQVRDSEKLLFAELVIATTDVPNRYLLSAVSTEMWTVGELYSDVEYLINGRKLSSPTITITVEEDFTYDR